MKGALRISFLIALFFAGVVVSCKKDKPASINFGYNYYPNTVGKYIIYDVDSIYCSSFDYKIDTIKYQLKELVQSMFYDNTGRPTQRIERYVRNYDSTSWTLRNVWIANVTATDAEKVESNVRYIKLVFPVTLNKSWNGNAYNTLGSASYNYTGVDQPLLLGVNNKNFDSTLTVIQVMDSTLISDSLSVEKYARNVGLIYKEVIAVSNDCPFTSASYLVPILHRAYTTGILKYTLTVNSYN